MSEQAYKTPLIDLLRNVPKDHRTQWPIQWSENGSEIGHAMCPIGRLAHEAADRIVELEALQSGEPVAVADRGVLNWIDGKQFNREADLYTTPQPVVPPQWRVVMRGMVEYAECNDPGNPYLDQAKALLSAGKGGE